MQARSLDGGRSWNVAPTPCRTPGGRGLSADEHVQPELWTLAAIEQGLPDAPAPCPGGGGLSADDFTHPDFALMCGRTGLKAGARSWFYTSTDRCRSWQGPFSLPMFGFTGIAGPHRLSRVRAEHLHPLPDRVPKRTARKAASSAPARPMAGDVESAGSLVGPEPSGFAIMPASLRLSPTRILVRRALLPSAPRRVHHRTCHWIDLYASDDDGATGVSHPARARHRFRRQSADPDLAARWPASA